VQSYPAGAGERSPGSLPARMATNPPNGAEPDAAPRQCAPCRGTGRVISNLGGTPQQVPCPWCDGSGRFVPGHDAQARHRAGADPG